MFRKMLRKLNNGKVLKSMVVVIAAIVVFATTYSLILPAITIDVNRAKEEAGIVLESSEQVVPLAASPEEAEEEKNQDVEEQAGEVEQNAAEKAAAAEDAEAVEEADENDSVTEKAAEETEAAEVEEAEKETSANEEYTEDEESVTEEANEEETAGEEADEEESANEEETAEEASPAEETEAAEEDTKAANDDADENASDEDTKKSEQKDQNKNKKNKKKDKLETTVITADGESYKISVAYKEDSGIPEDAGLEVREIEQGTEEYQSYLVETAIELNAADFEYARIFDITIIDKDGTHLNPEVPVDVTVELLDTVNESEDFEVVHFNEESERPEQMAPETDGNVVSFSTDSFSAYAIVQGPSDIPVNWEQLKTMNALKEAAASGVYIGTTGGFYLKNRQVTGSQDKNTQGIEKTKPAQSFPSDEAKRYYFEAVEGQTNQFYVYCYDDENNKQYVRSTGDQNLYLTTDESQKTPFTAQVDNNGRFRFNYGNRYWNMWNGNGGNHIAAYDVASDGNNYFYIWKETGEEGDPYGLDGTTCGLMYWIDGTTGKAMMAETNGNNLDALALTVMAKKTKNTDKLFVPDNSGISFWTFEWAGDDDYYLSSIVDGVKKYLKVVSGKLSMVDTKDDSCKIQVIPGTGAHAGEICLKSGNKALTYSGNIDTGFTTGGSVGTEWLHLVEESELSNEYFMTYSAEKVSVSDESITNGSRVIVYTRTWNEQTKKYEFYAIDHDGTLVRCYESGDSIEWVGQRLNSLLWNFVEYYWEGTETPNYYYELYNQYSEKYIAPQHTGDQTLSDNTIGINLNGRRNGQYYSSILAWDDDAYAYTGLKVENGRIVTCPQNEAADFYFAIMEDIPADDKITTVPTVDHEQYGITMKIVDFATRAEMSNFLGSNDKYVNGNTENDLLETALGTDGYPVTSAGNSLKDWFENAQQVNHLFIESTFKGTGYYEFDSTQNFAHLNGDNFDVYKQLGTMDGSGSGKFYTHGQFMPFNDIKAGNFASGNPKNTTSATGANLPDSDPRKYERLYLVNNPNYYMGVELQASFTQTPDGLDDWGHDIIYEFTGDDDFWLFVDGELIIDLGGVHDAIPGSVNYRTGEVNVNGRNTTLKTLFEENYRKRNPNATDAQVAEYLLKYFDEGSEIFRDYSSHTMKIYYLERGAGASNLHMRFNLASIKPGTVELSKVLTGVDSTETILAEFPYQIYYTDEAGNEHLLEQGDALNPTVLYKNRTTRVTYYDTFDVAGKDYEKVFLLKPGEIAEISFPEGTQSYRVVECGVNTEIYKGVKANGTVLNGTAAEGLTNRKDYGIDPATTEDRPRVTYENEVDPEAVKEITIEKKLFNEDGTSEISNDTATFSFRLYLATEHETNIDDAAANMKTYHVKDPAGNYCRWDEDAMAFISLGKTEFEDLDDTEKAAARFTTSMNGSISRIPSGYTVEIRGVLAGTKFKVVERPSEIPDGYSFQKYEYNDRSYTDAWEGVTDTLKTDADAHVIVRNLKGWGLRVNKLWSDADYMEERDPVYFAVYTNDGKGNLTLVQTEDVNTVRQMPYGEKTLYWYFLPLPIADVPFSQYEIREVTVENPVVDEDGYVTGGTVTPIENGGELKVEGKQIGETQKSEFTYTVTYEKGEIEEESNVRVDTVANSRPGIVLKKTDWSGTPLSDATFTLADKETGTVIGTFTSDSKGLITVAFLREDADYVLTETKAPHMYHGLENSMTIRLNDGQVTISGVDEEYYTLKQELGETPELTIKNRPFELKVVKQGVKSSGQTEILSGVPFELHREVTVDGVTSMELSPLHGYENLVSEEETGIVPKVDQNLQARTYYLVEKKAAEGYLKLHENDVRFTISEIGKVTVTDTGMAVLTSETDEVTGKLTYTITVKNLQAAVPIRIVKVDQSGQPVEGAEFSIAGAGIETRTDLVSRIPAGGSYAEIYYNDSVPAGTYTLTETKAPAGYYELAGSVSIHVESAADGFKVSAKIGSEEIKYPQIEKDLETGEWIIKIVNKNGYELPAAGGIGTKIFTIIGAALAVLAGVVLVVRRRLAA